MHLGKLHKLIVKNRLNHEVQETKFIGRLIDQARIISEPSDVDDKNIDDNPYSVIMKNAFSCSENRNPLSNANARAILNQKLERHPCIVNYLKENIGLEGLKNIINTIIAEDNLTVNNKRYEYQEDEFSNIIVLTQEFEESQLIDIYADYITEYYYYSVLWNVVEYALAGAEDIKSSFFKSDSDNRKIICRHISQTDEPRFPVFFKNNRNIVKNLKKSFEIQNIDDVTCTKRRYDLPIESFDYWVKKICVSDNYIVCLMDRCLLIYEINNHNLYKSVFLPQSYCNPIEIIIDNVSLYLFYDDCYFIIELDNIRSYLTGYRKNNSESFEKVFEKKELNYKCKHVIYNPQNKTAYYCDDYNIIRMVLNADKEEKKIYEAPAMLRRFVISNSERYIILVDQDGNAIMLDQKTQSVNKLVENNKQYFKTRLEEIYDALNNERSYFGFCWFSENEEYFIFSFTEKQKNYIKIYDLTSGVVLLKIEGNKLDNHRLISNDQFKNEFITEAGVNLYRNELNVENDTAKISQFKI